MTEIKPKRKSGVLSSLLFLALLGTPMWLAPRLIRGFAASDWIAYYAATEPLPRPHKATARAIVERANTAIQNLAPLPQSSGVAMQALEVGQRFQNQEHDREAALAIYQGVRASCEEVRSKPLSGTGFAVVEARAAALEDSAKDVAPTKAPAAK